MNNIMNFIILPPVINWRAGRRKMAVAQMAFFYAGVGVVRVALKKAANNRIMAPTADEILYTSYISGNSLVVIFAEPIMGEPTRVFVDGKLIPKSRWEGLDLV